MYAEEVVESLRSSDALTASLPLHGIADWFVMLALLIVKLS